MVEVVPQDDVLLQVIENLLHLIEIIAYVPSHDRLVAASVRVACRELLDRVVDIPMIGMGASLCVALAGSLVLYRLVGLA